MQCTRGARLLIRASTSAVMSANSAGARMSMVLPQPRNDTTSRNALAGSTYMLFCRLEARMIPFFVQIKCQLGKSYQVPNKLADAEIASKIYSPAGDFHLLVKFYVDPSPHIGHF